jgi:hypothetical protein
MEPWRARALELFPELEETIRQARSPMALWVELNSEFHYAYTRANQDLIRRVYEYARWCLAQERHPKADHDLLTCVLLCFFKSIPTEPASQEDMPRWFTRQEVLDLRATFSDLLGEDEWDRLLQRFDSEPLPREAERRDGKRYRDYWLEKQKLGRRE